MSITVCFSKPTVKVAAVIINSIIVWYSRMTRFKAALAMKRSSRREQLDA
jgi:hypothetical protein